jgi:hypothetical protein
MEEIDKFINFLFKNIDDNRITLNKEVKFGHRCYYLTMMLEKEGESSLYYNELSIVIDNRNECMILSNSYYEPIRKTIENKELVKKWSDIFEKYISDNLEKDIKCIIHNTMSDVKDKDLYREYQIEKIFKQDESI